MNTNDFSVIALNKTFGTIKPCNMSGAQKSDLWQNVKKIIDSNNILGWKQYLVWCKKDINYGILRYLYTSDKIELFHILCNMYDNHQLDDHFLISVASVPIFKAFCERYSLNEKDEIALIQSENFDLIKIYISENVLSVKAQIVLLKYDNDGLNFLYNQKFGFSIDALTNH